MQNSKLKPQARPHSLAELEVAIARAEADRDHYRQSLSHKLDDDGLRRTKALLTIAEQRLALLGRSRAVLLIGEETGGIEAETST